MTDQSAQEPTMEEILASIRRIISEDDAPAETAPAEAAQAEEAPVAEVAPEPAPEPEPETSPAMMDETPSVQDEPAAADDVLELTEEAPTETIGDLDVSPVQPDPFPAVSESAYVADEPVATPEHPSIPTPSEGLVGAGAASTAGAAFAGLASSLRKPEPAEPTVFGGPTIDELARQLLRPMLKEWLDANLPGIVEAQVRKEVERIARSAG